MITGDLPHTEAIRAALELVESAAYSIIAGPAGIAVRDNNGGLCIFTEDRLVFAGLVAEVRFDD